LFATATHRGADLNRSAKIMIRILLAFLIAPLAHAASGFGVGAFPLSRTAVSMWILGGADTDKSRPLVLVYFTGPENWHQQRWESKFDGNVERDAPVSYRLVSSSVTLEIRVSSDRKTFRVQGEEFGAAENNVFVVTNANNPKLQRVEKIGRLNLPSDTDEPLSVVVLRDNAVLRSHLE
jgi:hypothetical protein